MSRLPISVAIVSLVLVFGGLAYIESGENPSSKFADYEALADSNLIRSGWVPNYIPRSAYEIEETHNLDSNIVYLNFKFKPGDGELPKKNCDSETIEGNGKSYLCKEAKIMLFNDGNGYFTNDPNAA